MARCAQRHQILRRIVRDVLVDVVDAELRRCCAVDATLLVAGEDQRAHLAKLLGVAVPALVARVARTLHPRGMCGIGAGPLAVLLARRARLELAATLRADDCHQRAALRSAGCRAEAHRLFRHRLPARLAATAILRRVVRSGTGERAVGVLIAPPRGLLDRVAGALERRRAVRARQCHDYLALRLVARPAHAAMLRDRRAAEMTG